jgi:hypothetical protein
MSTLHHVPPTVHSNLRLVEAPAPAKNPCPSEARYGSACYLAFHNAKARWCDRCLSECGPGDVPAWLTRPTPSAPGEPRLPMADWIEVEAGLVRLKGSNLAEWLAGRLDDLAGECRWLAAETPEDFEARSEAWQRTIERIDSGLDPDALTAYPEGGAW